MALVAGCGGGGDDEQSAAPTSSGGGQTSKSPPPTGDGTGGVVLTKLGDFSSPVYVAQPPGEQSDLYVVEKGGAIRVIDDGRVRSDPFLDLTGGVSGELEQGLLSMAFAPDYQSSGRFYVDYTDRAGDSRIVEYRRSTEDRLRADESTARQVLFQDQPFANHNGGLVLFGPDKKLYVGFGDGGSAGDPDRNGQDLETLLGKILRIDPRPGGGRPYTAPPDNPFAGQSGARPEIFIYGLRNPWRFSFDPATGALTIGDVGQDTQEEIDYIPAGRAAGQNLGWSAFEGTHPFNRDQMQAVKQSWWSPALIYGRDEGCSVTGGYVVRDPNLSSLYGRYLYGDFCAGRLRSFIPAPGAETGRDDREVGLEVPSLSSFGEDSSGRVYAMSLDGPVYRLDPAGG